MSCFSKINYDKYLDHNKLYDGYITAYGKYAATIKQKNGRQWYVPLKYISKDLKNEFKNEFKNINNIHVIFISNLKQYSGTNNNGKRFYAKNIKLYKKKQEIIIQIRIK